MQQIGSPYTYPDSNDLFQREPYVAEFKARNGNFDFVLITIHTDPDTATQEINDLPAVGPITTLLLPDSTSYHKIPGNPQAAYD